MCSTPRQDGEVSSPLALCRKGVMFRESWYLFHSGSSRLRNDRQGTLGRDRRNGDRSRPPSRTSARRDPVGPAWASSQPPSREEDLRCPRSHSEGWSAARDPAARRNHARHRAPESQRVSGPGTPHAGAGPGCRGRRGRPDPPGDACGTAPPPSRKRPASPAVETGPAVRDPGAGLSTHLKGWAAGSRRDGTRGGDPGAVGRKQPPVPRCSFGACRGPAASKPIKPARRRTPPGCGPPC